MIECSGPISGTFERGNLETRPLHGATTLRFWFDHRTIAYMTTAPLHHSSRSGTPFVRGQHRLIDSSILTGTPSAPGNTPIIA